MARRRITSLDIYLDALADLRKIGLTDFALIGVNDSLHIELYQRRISEIQFSELVKLYSFDIYPSTFDGNPSLGVILIDRIC